MEIRGRDLINGLPKTVKITSEEIRDALLRAGRRHRRSGQSGARKDAAGTGRRHHRPRHDPHRRRRAAARARQALVRGDGRPSHRSRRSALVRSGRHGHAHPRIARDREYRHGGGRPLGTHRGRRRGWLPTSSSAAVRSSFRTIRATASAAIRIISEAVDRIYHAKGRPDQRPLTLQVASPAEFLEYARENALAILAAKRLLPGPITLVVRRPGFLSDEAAVRVSRPSGSAFPTRRWRARSWIAAARWP